MKIERLFLEASNRLIGRFPCEIKTAIERCEAEGTLDNPEYQKAKFFYYSNHLCRLNPMPDDMMASIKGLQEDSTVNHTMYVCNLISLLYRPIQFTDGKDQEWPISDEENWFIARLVY